MQALNSLCISHSNEGFISTIFIMNNFEYVNEIPLSMNVTLVFNQSEEFQNAPLEAEKQLFGITLEAKATLVLFTLHVV